MRFTKKGATREGTTIGFPKAVECYWKLKNYEDIEEELGIDISILIKALQKGIYGTLYGGTINSSYEKIIHIKPIQFKLCLHVDEPCIYYEWGWPGPDYNRYKLKDYGKTWALTKEELKKWPNQS